MRSSASWAASSRTATSEECSDFVAVVVVILAVRIHRWKEVTRSAPPLSQIRCERGTLRNISEASQFKARYGQSIRFDQAARAGILTGYRTMACCQL